MPETTIEPISQDRVTKARVSGVLLIREAERMTQRTTPPDTTAERDYDHRCATCRHDVWQNDATGDCRVFHKDVLHEDVRPCSSYEGLTQ